MSSRLIAVGGRAGSARTAVLTILPEELAAIRTVFGGLQNLPGTPYYVRPGELPPDGVHDWVVRKAADRGNVPATQAMADIIEDFWPAFIILVGIAGGFGGRDGLNVGDVVIADAVAYCEFKKLHKSKILPRLVPLAHPSLYLRERFAEPLIMQPDRWVPLIRATRPGGGSPKAIVGNLVAGETLMPTRQVLSRKES